MPPGGFCRVAIKAQTTVSGRPVALLAIAACGRIAEKVAGGAKQQENEEPVPQVEALPAPQPEANEP